MSWLLGEKWYVVMNPLFNHTLIQGFPKINLNFPTMIASGYELSFTHWFLYYGYAYGIRIILYGLAFYWSFRNEKKIFSLLCGLLIVFVLINTIQLSPLSIYDNHKWLKPFNFVTDIFAILAVLNILNMKKNISKIILPVIIFAATISGTISFLMFFFQRHDIMYADYKSKIYQRIRSTAVSSVFLTNDPTYVFLAGRKTYVADYLGGELEIDTSKSDILSLQNKNDICKYMKQNDLINAFDYSYVPEKIFFNVEECQS